MHASPKEHTWQMFKFRAYDVAPGDHSINVKHTLHLFKTVFLNIDVLLLN